MVRKPTPTIVRFEKYYQPEPNSGCWLWLRRLCKGYAYISEGNKEIRAHRWAYEYFKGPIPKGLELHHSCRTKSCVNPQHLQPLTRLEHYRLDNPGFKFHGDTHQRFKIDCPQGHPYSGNNLYVSPDNRRHCRICVRESGRRYDRTYRSNHG